MKYAQQTLLPFSTLVDLLRWRASFQPDQVAYIFLKDGLHEERMTYAALDRRARSIAARLQERDIMGERVLLLYPPGLEYICAFFGCLYAGAVAVPAYPPRTNRPSPRLQTLVCNAQAKAALCTTSLVTTWQDQIALAPELALLQWIGTDVQDEVEQPTWSPPALTEQTLAFLQYTSGSTDTPRGVMLSHTHLLHNLKLISQYFETTPQTRAVIWLPPYHDMGLIGGILQPLYAGFPVVLMPPASLLTSPYRWLQAIAHYQATISGGPNFAYDLCTRKITPQQRSDLDLTSWELAFCGAEPIHYHTMSTFIEQFTPCGFHAEAFYPCYGLAEATLIVTGGARGTLPVSRAFDSCALKEHRVVEVLPASDQAQFLVGCGYCADDQRLLIVHPETHSQCSPGEIGEIWVSGPSIAQGYWQQPQETRSTFQAFLSTTGEGPFLRTGDLGFLSHGHLFVTGRIKDLMIIRGLNYYPQDIEHTVERASEALRPGCGAAFSVEVATEEQLVVVQEIERQFLHQHLDEAIRAIRQAVMQQHNISLAAVILLKPGSIPKTSSGKIQRQRCKQAFLDGTLAIAASSLLAFPPSQADEVLNRPLLLATLPSQRKELVERYVLRQITAMFHASGPLIDLDQGLQGLGLDSLMAVELMNRFERDLQVSLSMDELLQNLSIRQVAARILDQATAEPGSPIPLLEKSENNSGCYPLSYAQQRLWFLNQLLPASPLYNIPAAARLRGELDRNALAWSLNELVKRHEILRTTFTTKDGQPMQQVHARLHVPFVVIDLTALPSREGEGQRLLNDEAARPFDLERGPLLRATLLQVDRHEHVFIVNTHHIISDAWSIEIFVQELGSLYNSYLAGQPAALPEPRVSYNDFAQWQVQWLQGERLERLLTYWRQQLAGTPEGMGLPTDRPRPAIQSYRGARFRFLLPAALSNAVKQLSRQHRVTPFMTLLAIFQTLLHRYTGQQDIVIGIPISGRVRPEIEKTLGFFVNTLVLRINLSGNPSFLDLLERTRAGTLAAYQHQDLPFDRLVEEMHVTRNPGYHPLFQVMFQFQNTSLPALELDGLASSSLPIDNGTAKFDLILLLEETGQELNGSFEYNTELFDASTISRFASHFHHLLASAVADPARRLSEIPFLTTAELQQLLLTWNVTQTPYRFTCCLHQLFEAQVERDPTRVAVIAQDESLSYQDLNQRADRLAAYLQHIGVRPETRVGICVERSLDFVIAILGTLKAGGVYVPLDPAYPGERLDFMLADSQAQVLLTQHTLLDRFSSRLPFVLCLDTAQRMLQSFQHRPAESGVVSANLAYLIYTSGSTGTPKGIAVTHGGVVNNIMDLNQRFNVGPGDSALVVSSLSFDMCVYEVLGLLAAGGSIVLPSIVGERDPAHWADLIMQHHISVWNSAPSLLALLVDYAQQRSWINLSSLRLALLGGDWIPVPLPDRLKSLARDVQIISLGGATEASIHSTIFPIAETNPSWKSIPYGHPMANQHVYVMDQAMQLTPPGAPGELYLGGAGLARGYLTQVELTAEKFVPHPFSSHPGERLYRTGDLVRWQADGNLELLGRLDYQVKLRGIRIDLREINAVLRQLPAIEEAVTMVQEDKRGEKQLVAFLVSHQKPVLTTREVRNSLRNVLPDHMLPAAVVTLDALPLTPNGKLDRSALPSFKTLKPETGNVFCAPRTPLEQTLAALWAEVLDIEQVSINDNFFELGGHSLLAVQIAARFQEIFSTRLPLRSLFATPTIAELAAYIEASSELDQQHIMQTAELFSNLSGLSADQLQALLVETEFLEMQTE